jgi:hypothetical protein
MAEFTVVSSSRAVHATSRGHGARMTFDAILIVALAGAGLMAITRLGRPRDPRGHTRRTERPGDLAA